MLALNCCICADLLKQTDEVYVTPCGHLFHYACLAKWLGRSQTCPQCRNACKRNNIQRVYFNVANLDATQMDAGALHEELNNVKLQLKMNNIELEKTKDKCKSLGEKNDKNQEKIDKLEHRFNKDQILLNNYSDQVKFLKYQLKEMEELQKKIDSQQQQIQTMTDLQIILNETKTEAENLVKNERNPKTLALWVTTLKRELKLSENKRSETRYHLKVVQNDLRKQIDISRAQLQEIRDLESEVYDLKEKFENLSKKDSSNTNIKLNSYVEDSPITQEKRPDSSRHMKGRQTSEYNVVEGLKIMDKSPNEENGSNSPYFNIKASWPGFAKLCDIQQNDAFDQWSDRNNINNLNNWKNLNSTHCTNLTGTKPKFIRVKTLTSIKNQQRLLMAGGAIEASLDGCSTGSSKCSDVQYIRDGYDGCDGSWPIDENIKPLIPETNNEKPHCSIDSRLKSGRLRNFQINKTK